MTRRFALLAAVLVLAACASDKAATDPAKDAPEEGETKLVAKPSESPAEVRKREQRLNQTLMDIDRRVDRFVLLASQPGEDARTERALLAPALKAQVAEFKPDLLRMIADPENEQRRRVAAKALAVSDDPAAVTALVKVLGERDTALVTNATYALGRIQSPATPAEPLLALVRHSDNDIRGNALMALWHVFDAKSKLGGSPLDPVAQREAMSILEVALFDMGDPIIRANAAAAVGALGDPRGVDSLLNLLQDDHPLVRTQTAIALGKLGDPKAIPALVKVIDTTPRGTPRSAVCLSLSSLCEKQGLRVPANIGDEGRVWERFVRDEFVPRQD
jgi:HEAT repeat protein